MIRTIVAKPGAGMSYDGQSGAGMVPMFLGTWVHPVAALSKRLQAAASGSDAGATRADAPQAHPDGNHGDNNNRPGRTL